METIFKVGMKVYDQFVFPNKEGKVLKIDESGNYPVRVSFGNPGITWSYTRDGRYYSNMEPSLSTSLYSIVGFEQKAPAPTYEVAVDWLEKNSKDRVIYADEAYINEEYERAFEALKKLTILRDYYNEGWKPDWTKATVKYCIEVYGENLSIIDFQFKLKPMAFKTRKIRDKFLEEQRELLEIAKPLL